MRFSASSWLRIFVPDAAWRHGVRAVQAGYPLCLLSQQYRMHPAISAFPASFFYSGKLLDAAAVAGGGSAGAGGGRTAPWHDRPCLPPLAFWDCREVGGAPTCKPLALEESQQVTTPRMPSFLSSRRSTFSLPPCRAARAASGAVAVAAPSATPRRQRWRMCCMQVCAGHVACGEAAGTAAELFPRFAWKCL